MNFEFIDHILHINVDVVTSVAAATMLFLLGYFIKTKIKFLDTYCIPAPVVGAFLFMLITWFGKSAGLFVFNFATTMQMFFMLAFFACIGLGVSFSLLKKGGVLLLVYWGIACALALIQNIVAITAAPLVGIENAYALLCGSVSMTGGHGTSAAYGVTMIEFGYPAATLVGASASTFGLVAAVTLGGPIARLFIEKYNLRPSNDDYQETFVNPIITNPTKNILDIDIMKNIAAILLCMSIGSIISGRIGLLIHMTFPPYVSTMFVAILLRNINEKFHFYRFDFHLVEKTGDISLGIFLSMAMMTLHLWELAGMAGGMLIILGLQVLLIIAFIPIVFRILGKNYDAAVMCAGLMGHGLGATPSAIANMTVLNRHYGTSHKAMIIVPIVGAFMVDLFNQPTIIWFLSMFVKNLN